MGLFEVLEDRIFAKRIALSPEYVPDKLISREKQLKQVASLFAPALKGDKPHNAFIYGKTGVGKTAITKYVLLELDQEVSRAHARVKSTFVNCKQVNTTTKILKRICNVIAPEVEVPSTGIATSEYYDRLWKILNNFDGIIIVVFDEVDKLEDDGILYNLSRARENLDVTNGFISVLGISNDLNYKERIDVRTLSSFGNKEFVFPPYDALQLREILEDRARIGFRQGVLETEVIPLCGALAAQEHGDARKALTLLEYAGEIAVEKGSSLVTEADVREAQERSEMDRIVEAMKTLPLHEKIALLGIVSGGMREMDTNEVYLNYRALCEARELKPLTKVRVSNFISELDMLGLITARKVSRGRYGLTRLITPNVSKERVEGLLHD
ncbi:MAG: orc1/cdc6 family replication initiation protein [Halobacteriota archaeon]